MATQKALIKLRAFNVTNKNITMGESDILPLLKATLEDKSKVQDRRMKLNEQDNDEDILSYFDWQQSSYIFGMMMRIIPAENGGVISDELFDRETIKISDIDTGNAGERQYKDHYYFALNNSYLITNLSGSYSIDRLQTYINWLLGDVRQENYFETTPITKVPEGVKIEDIRKIEFGDSGVNAKTETSTTEIRTKLKELSGTLLETLLKDSTSLGDINREELVSATLMLKIKAKPEAMAEDDYKRIMGAMTKQITNDSGFTIVAKNGKKYNGAEIKVVKDEYVEKTKSGRIVEEQLKQKMESFLRELNNKQ